MKTFIVAMLVLIILVGSVFSISAYLTNVEIDLIEIAEEVSVFSKKGEWDVAFKRFEKLSDKWDKKENIFSVFYNHEDLDDINLAMGNLKESILHNDLEHTLKAVSEIKILLERLIKNESLSIENILLAPNRFFCHIML